MHTLQRYFAWAREHFGLPEKALEEIISACQRYEAPKKELLTEVGQVERYIYFVEKGVQRSYFLHKNKEVTFQFTYPPDSTGIPESFFLQQPSRFYLECLTDSSFWRLSHEKMQGFCDKYPEFALWRRVSVEQLLAGMIQKQMEQQAMSSKERFQVFMKRSPHLFQMVPQKYIASYLGMSAETFSVLLNNVRL